MSRAQSLMQQRMQHRMQHSDAFAWYMEDDPALRSTVVAVIRLDRDPDWHRLRARIKRLTELVPQLRMRVQSPRLRWVPPRWTEVPDFDLDRHLVRRAVPAPADWDAVLELAREAAETEFDRRRPLWEFVVVNGLADGSAALVMRLHHSLTDGVGGIQLAAQVLDLGPDLRDEQGGLPIPPARPGPAPAPPITGRLAHRAGTRLRAAGRQVRSVWRVVRPVRAQLSPVFGERGVQRHVGALDVPLAGLREAAARAGGRVNDAFLAGVLDGLTRYHQLHGAFLPGARVTMPVSLRTDRDEPGGNKITLLRIALPTGHADPVERMRAIGQAVRTWRTEPALAHTQGIARSLNLLPRGYVGNMLKRIEAVASNVPGVPVPVWLAGARLTGFYGFGPTIGAAVNVTLMSYADTCHIGVNVDARAVPDPDALLPCLRDAFAEVVALGRPVDRERSATP